jgi:hypothetical protein
MASANTPGGQVIVFYHKGCSDGFGAATVYYHYLTTVLDGMPGNLIRFKAIDPTEVDARLDELPVKFGTSGRLTVILLDLAIKMSSYQKLTDLHAKNVSCIVVDHHKTTLDELKDVLKVYGDDNPGVNPYKILSDPLHIVRFHMDYSGATLTWLVFPQNRQTNPGSNPRFAMPYLVRYIEDRDLWKFELPNSREVCSGIYALLPLEYETESEQRNKRALTAYPGETKVPYFEDWINELRASDVYLWPARAQGWSENFRAAGKAIQEQNQIQIKMIANGARDYRVGQYVARICNSQLFISELGEYLYTTHPGHENIDFVLIWRYDHYKGKCYVSLRSRNTMYPNSNPPRKGADVKTISALLGGGGHEHAAGFECSFEAIGILMSNPSIASRETEEEWRSRAARETEHNSQVRQLVGPKVYPSSDTSQQVRGMVIDQHGCHGC